MSKQVPPSDPTADAQAGLCPSDTDAGAAGAPPSNTAPPKYTGSEPPPLLLLTKGVDSLYVSYQGQMLGEIERRLDFAKECAQSPDWETQTQAIVTFGGQQFEVRPRGRTRYLYVLKSEAFDIQLRPG